MSASPVSASAAQLLARLFRAWSAATDARQIARLERMIAAAFDLAGPDYIHS